jgi:hypothetical protein
MEALRTALSVWAGGEGCSVAEMYRSGLPEDEVGELARKVVRIICDERPSLGNKLPSSTIRDRLREEGIEPPDYAMHDAISQISGLITYSIGGPQNPDDPDDAEAVRRHGGITVVGVDEEACVEF